MDELINILVFIGTIAIFIFSAIRKSKKKPETGKYTSAINLESLFGIQTDTEDEFSAEVPEIKAKEEEPIESIVSDIDKNEGIDTITNKIKKTEISDEVFEELEFDLKSAIVYTEILNRKNF